MPAFNHSGIWVRYIIRHSTIQKTPYPTRIKDTKLKEPSRFVIASKTVNIRKYKIKAAAIAVKPATVTSIPSFIIPYFL
jgi:hypothetical protein